MTRPVIMPQQVTRIAPYGSLLKQPRAMKVAKRPFHSIRERDETHLTAIRQLPCLKCGVEPCGEAAHVRLNSGAHGKRNSMGAKPSDQWAVSLCPDCHTRDPDSQHKIGEAIFWDTLGINPILVCEALYAVSPDVVKMRAVIFLFVSERQQPSTGGNQNGHA